MRGGETSLSRRALVGSGRADIGRNQPAPRNASFRRDVSGRAGLGRWAKTVQLDLEAKGIARRDKSRPLRLRKA
ncbi:DUF6958 family protein [Mesorhizobium sp. L-8-3]|uniref:DUF6958 family protein n=1 Tax=unclassified Mesorhizobium TaxID=325217 RepID=UPI00406C7483